MISTKRVYEPAEAEDGARFLVERLWPRGVKKASLPMQAWMKEVAPSDELRRWFGHEPEKWDEFQRRYRLELQSQPDVWQPILEAARHGNVTLIYSAHDTQHNNAIALKSFLDELLSDKR